MFYIYISQTQTLHKSNKARVKTKPFFNVSAAVFWSAVQHPTRLRWSPGWNIKVWKLEWGISEGPQIVNEAVKAITVSMV